MKKFLSLFLAVLMSLSVMAGALAEPGRGGGGGNQSAPDQQQGDRQPGKDDGGSGSGNGRSDGNGSSEPGKPDNGDQNGSQDKNSSQGQSSDQDQNGGQNQNGQNQQGQPPMDDQRPQQGKPTVDTDAIEEAIGELTDTTVADSLTALLEAYEEAAASGGEAEQAALTALLDALKDAGITAGLEEPSGNGQQPGQGKPTMDTDAIEEAIAALTDTTVAESLTALLTAYEEAAATGGEAEQAALTALLDALKEAGITAGLEEPSGNGQQPGQGKPVLDTDAIEEAIAALTDATVADSLTALLTAYENAESSGQEAAEAALAALVEALESVGITVDEDKPLDVQGITEAIGELADTTVAESLTALLAAYQEAQASGREAAQAALTALLDALKDAGITLGGEEPSPDGKPQQGKPAIDTDAIEEAIGELTDTTVAENLTALLTAYENAESSSQEATEAALTALVDALEDAGITVDEDKPLDVKKITEAIGELTDTTVVENLTELLAAYQKAESSGRDAVQAALTALLDALKDAGITPEAE
jgi:uncharacterized protein YjgD (DUF1641 family)